MRLAHGMLYPDGGSIRVLGLDPASDGLALRSGFESELAIARGEGAAGGDSGRMY